MLYSNSQGIQKETQLCDTGTNVAEMETILPFFDSLSVTWNHWFLMANTFVQCHINSGVKTNKVLVSTFSYKRELHILILQYPLCREYIGLNVEGFVSHTTRNCTKFFLGVLMSLSLSLSFLLQLSSSSIYCRHRHNLFMSCPPPHCCCRRIGCRCCRRFIFIFILGWLLSSGILSSLSPLAWSLVSSSFSS